MRSAESDDHDRKGGTFAVLLATIDYYYTKVLSLSFVGHACAVIALLLTPPAPTDFDDDLGAISIVFDLQWPADPLPPPRVRRIGDHKDAPAGTPGSPTSPRQRRAPGRSSSLTDRQEVARSPILLAIDAAGKLADRVMRGSLDVDTASEGMQRGPAGLSHGTGGTTSRGSGPGGDGTISIGPFGQGGQSVGAPIDPSLAPAKRFRLARATPSVSGCVSQASVRRAVERLRSQARNCYEQGLQRDPNMRGKVTTHFVIDATGAVSSARIVESTINESGVEQCLLKIIVRHPFPACRGGGVAEVTHSWIFSSTE